MSAFRDPVVIFGLAMMCLGLALMFALPGRDDGSWLLFGAFGCVLGRLSALAR
jgi:hypothetical protein